VNGPPQPGCHVPLPLSAGYALLAGRATLPASMAGRTAHRVRLVCQYACAGPR
jgi:hypothetical protein